MRVSIIIRETRGQRTNISFTTFKYPEGNHDESVGHPLDGLHIRVSSNQSIMGPPDQTAGELLVCGAQLMTRYFNDRCGTEQVFERGWLKKGDLGYVENGRVYLIDRVKSIIKVNEFQVSPAELEGVIWRCL